MEIIVNRASVCMGDDVYSHVEEFILPDDATYDDLFQKIIKTGYLPSIAGNNVVWVLSSKEYFCIFSYFTRTGKRNDGLVEKRLSEICKNSNELMFKYMHSPERWKNCIVNWYKGDTYTMWRDGWLEELKYCDYVTELGIE